jgi:hypothetical protein
MTSLSERDYKLRDPPPPSQSLFIFLRNIFSPDWYILSKLKKNNYDFKQIIMRFANQNENTLINNNSINF